MGLLETIADQLPGINPARLNHAREVASHAASTPNTRTHEARLAYERGWILTPLRGKRPTLRGWTTAAAPTLEQAEQWARQGNVGLRTGSVSGIVVIDDDTLEGNAASMLELPETPTVITGSGNWHHYFRCPPCGLSNSASRLAPKVDVRGDGGQVVFVGSIHPITKLAYTWAPELSPDDVPLASLPDAVLETLLAAPSSRPNGGRLLQSDLEATEPLVEAAAHIAAAAVGVRNDTLNAESFRIGRLIQRGLIAELPAIEALHEAGLRAGLSPAEVRSTVESGLGAGLGVRSSAHASVCSGRSRESEGEKPMATKPVQPPRSTILVEGGQLPEQVDAAEKALLADNGGEAIYQRSGLLVRTCRLETPRLQSGLERTPGSLMILPIDVPYLVERLTRAAEWTKWDGRKRSVKRVDCPENVARTYLARRGEWNVPTLLGVVEAPTIRQDGSVLHTPGFDSTTGLYFDPGAVSFASIPQHPDLDDARAGLRRILHLLSEFPWVAASDRAVAVSAILTALVRRSLRSAPLFAFRAPVMASGKSLLADVVAMMSTGRVASCMTQSGSEAEDRKRIFALLMEGASVACIDNVERELGGAALCSVLTQESYRDRILGRSETAAVPTRTTWMATGNNLILAGDISTRVVPCDLDPKQERPEERSFKLDLYDYVPRNRNELVPAALTILHAYNEAGRPDQGLPRFGRFEEWSDLVRSALVWCGEADPCEGRQRIAATDPVRRCLGTLLLQWDFMIGVRRFTAAEAIRLALKRRSDSPDFYGILCEVAGTSEGRLDARRLGIWLSQNERRRERGLWIERTGERQGSNLWQVFADKGD